MNQAKELLSFLLRRSIVALYKNFLTSIEDLRFEHKTMLEKLETSLPKEYHSLLKSADYLDDKKFNHIRKRILDSGNETNRALDEQMSQFKINF